MNPCKLRLFLTPTFLLLLLLAPSGFSAGLTPTLTGNYGSHPDERFLFFAPDPGTPTIGVVLFHPGIGGDEYQIVNHQNVRFLAELMLTNGIALYSIATPAVTGGQVHPTQINSAARAVQYLRGNSSLFAIDPGRVIYWGISYGAYVLGVLAYGPDYANPLGSVVEQQSTRPLAFFSQRGPSSFVILDDSFYGGWFGKQTLGQVPDSVRREASYAELLFANAPNRTYTPPALGYYNNDGSSWPTSSPIINPHTKALNDYFTQGLSTFALFFGQAQVLTQSWSLINPAPQQVVDLDDNESIVEHLLGWLKNENALSLGYSLSGPTGAPKLTLSSSVTVDSMVSFHATASTPGVSTLLLIGGPTKGYFSIPCGGTLVPSGAFFTLLSTNAAGAVSGNVPVPPGIPAGSIYYLQFFQPDPHAPCEYTASNAIKISFNPKP